MDVFREVFVFCENEEDDEGHVDEVRIRCGGLVQQKADWEGLGGRKRFR